jgi:hypothetical protein
MVAPDDSGPRAELRYFAGAVGHQGFPGTTAWNTVLGRYWSHRGAQRIVVLPSDPNRAWLLTSEGTFRSFRDVSPVDGIYEEVSPRNEYRALTTIPGGWELRYLDGTVSEFDSAGKWTLNRDANGNTAMALRRFRATPPTNFTSSIGATIPAL